jgi:hypothetical protein
MNLLLTIGVAITCVVLIVSALLIVLVGLLTSTSSHPVIQGGDVDDNDQPTGSEGLTNGRTATSAPQA